MAKQIKQPPTAPYTVTKETNKLTDAEIAKAAYDAGFRGQALETAIAVAIAEAHGNRTALNNRGEFSVGLWQINVNGYLSKRLNQWGYDSWTDLYDPFNNASAAYKLSKGGSKWGLWSTYKHGSHLKYMERAATAAKTVNKEPDNLEKFPFLRPDPPNTRLSYIPQVQPSNILPAASVKVSDPMVTIIIVGVIGIIVAGILLMTRNK